MATDKVKNIIIAVLVVIVLGLLYFQFQGGTGASAQEAVDGALAFINNVMLQGSAEASLVGDIEEEAGLYKFNLKVGAEEFPSYVSKDGKLLFPQAIPLETEETEEAEAPAATCEEIAKAETPILEAFVVSYCPFGLQMQRILVEIMEQAPELQDNIKISYMGEVVDGKVAAMHGDLEAEENLRQICLREEQKDKFLNYLSCFIQAGESELCLTQASVDTAELSSCMEAEDRGAKYAGEDFASEKDYGVTGSPTLILNGKKESEFNFGGRTAQAVKSLLCCSFNEEPENCSLELSEEQAATSFSETYSTEGSGESGSCE